MRNIEQIPVWKILDEIIIGASLSAQTRGVQFAVTNVDHNVFIEADQQIITAAVANLLQNAFKFTRPNTTVKLSAKATADRVLFDVEDACGGLPPGKHEDLFRRFEQRSADRSGVGLGLSICLKAAKTSGGELRVRDLPKQGCVFTLSLPRIPSPTLIGVGGGKSKSVAPTQTVGEGAPKAS